ncbi:MAG: YceD family protein [Acidimicrobiales bacterium]
MPVDDVLVLDVADLLQRPGRRRRAVLDAWLDHVATTVAGVPGGEPVHLDLDLQSVNHGIVVTGAASTPWVGECGRCLRKVGGRLQVPIRELYEERPTEGETQPLHQARIDVAPVVREAVLLELPQAPLCSPACAGLCPRCGADRNEGPCGCPSPEPDPRWSVLDELRLDE